MGAPELSKHAFQCSRNTVYDHAVRSPGSVGARSKRHGFAVRRSTRNLHGGIDGSACIQALGTRMVGPYLGAGPGLARCPSGRRTPWPRWYSVVAMGGSKGELCPAFLHAHGWGPRACHPARSGSARWVHVNTIRDASGKLLLAPPLFLSKSIT